MAGRPISKLFDLVCGTSIGGVGALLLAHSPGNSLEMGRRAFDVFEKGTFSTTSAARLFARGHRCDIAYRDDLREFFGCDRLDHTPHGSPRAFAVAAHEKAGVVEPFLLRTYSSDCAGRRLEELGAVDGTGSLRLWEAIAATTAAPTFFPFVQLEGGPALVDGAAAANNPSMLALAECEALWPGRPIGIFVSMGCGRPPGSKDGPSASLGTKGAVGLIVKALTAAGFELDRSAKVEKQVGDQMEEFLPATAYFRFNPEVTNVGFLETDAAVLKRMEDETSGYMQRRSADVERLCRLLRSPAALAAATHATRVVGAALAKATARTRMPRTA